MATGTVYPAKVALKALLEGWTWPTAAPVIQWGEPTRAEDTAYEAVYFGATELTDDFRTLGGERSDETYRLAVIVDVRDYGSEQDNEARAWELHDEILTLLQANMTLSGAINRITGYTVQQVNPKPDDEKWRTQILIRPECVGLVFY